MNRSKNTLKKGKPEDRTNSKPRSNRRGNRANFKKQSDMELKEASNNPEFYFRYPELMRHVTNIPFNVITNLPAPIEGSGTFNIPNVVTLSVGTISPCTPNVASERNTNMNQFMQDFYARVRRENSGARNYDPSDLTRFIFAMAEVFKRVNYLQRFYYMINYYEPLNRAFPIMLFRMMGMDYDSFKNNQAEFAARLDTLIVRAGTMFVPSDIPFLKRIAMMFQNYYIDTTDKRDTIYIPIPSIYANAGSFLTLDSTENLVFDSGGLKMSVGDLTTMDEVMTSAENFVNKVLASQDFGIMQGDILKAFPNANFTRLASLDPSFRQAPIYDKAMLMQYHNADIVDFSIYHKANEPYLGFDSSTGLPKGAYNANDAQLFEMDVESGYVVSPAVGNGFPNTKGRRYSGYLCLDEETTSPEWIVEVTRMKAGCGVDYIDEVNVYSSVSLDMFNAVISHFTNQPTDAQKYMYTGSMPYARMDYLTHNMQHLVRRMFANIALPFTNLTPWQQGISRFIPFDAGASRTYWHYRSICRYLPYSIIHTWFYGNGASASVPYARIDDNNDTVIVDTPMPIVQPVSLSNLKRLDNICWRSLLSFESR